MVLRGGKMGKEFENQKEFLINLDRILAGEKVETDAITDKDLSSVFAFAQKMAGLRVSASPEFKSQLKARLLKQLAEQEEAARIKTKSGWFSSFAQHQLIWQAVTAVLVIAIIGGVLWGTGLFRFYNNPHITTPIVSVTTTTKTVTTTKTTVTTTSVISTTTTTAPVNQEPLIANASTDKSSYPAGESVNIEVSLTNITSSPIIIDKFPPILSLMQADTLQPVYTFAAGTVEKTIDPHQTASFTVNWNQQDAKGQVVSPGVYYLELEDLDYQGKAIKLNFANPVHFSILPGTSSTLDNDRLISVNQSIIDNSITVTINSITIFKNGGVQVLATIPLPSDYPSGANSDYRAAAYYSIESGWVNDAGLSQMSGTNHIWQLPITISQNNYELIFIITRIGTYEGYWEFNISLN
jgi:hypothetical protein